MIVLRPLNVWRNITKLNQRFNVRTQPTASFSLVSHTRIVCTTPNSDIFRKSLVYLNVLPYRCLATNHHSKHLNAISTQNTSIWLQMRQNIDPYVRLMRIDRPIGE